MRDKRQGNGAGNKEVTGRGRSGKKKKEGKRPE